jgi:hypothetical protein
MLAIGAHTAQAALGERLLGFGSELSRLEGFHLTTTPRTVSLNGAQLDLVVATTNLSVAETLDRLEAICDQRGGVDGQTLLPKLFHQAAPTHPSWLSGHLRHESARDGVLACLDTGGALGLEALTTRLQAFASSGDLSRLGALRYATARRTGNVTTVLFVWTEGALPLRTMFSKQGDAPGVDPIGVPRPIGAERILSGIEHGAPYSLTAYRTRASTPEALLAWYRTALPAAGFAVADGPAGTLSAYKGTRTLLVHTARTGQAVTAAVAELK